MERFSIPYLIPTMLYRLDYEFDAAVTGTPDWELYTDGVLDVSGVGTLVAGNQWRFDITPSVGAVLGASARVRINADVGGPIFVDLYSGIANTANVIEKDINYRYQNNGGGAGFDDVTISDAP